MEEYPGHFAIGKSRGRTEEELCTALGSPEDVAKEIRAAFLIHKAEQTKSAGTIWQATRATTRLHGLSFAAVIVPFILFAVVFSLVFIAGLAMICGGAVLLLLAVAKLLGLALSLPWHPWRLSPEPGVLVSMGIFIAGIIVITADMWLGHFFGRVGSPAPQGKAPAKNALRSGGRAEVEARSVGVEEQEVTGGEHGGRGRKGVRAQDRDGARQHGDGCREEPRHRAATADGVGLSQEQQARDGVERCVVPRERGRVELDRGPLGRDEAGDQHEAPDAGGGEPEVTVPGRGAGIATRLVRRLSPRGARGGARVWGLLCPGGRGSPLTGRPEGEGARNQRHRGRTCRRSPSSYIDPAESIRTVERSMEGLGYRSFSRLSSSTRTLRAARFRNHLWSEGRTYQGAQGVPVRTSISS